MSLMKTKPRWCAFAVPSDTGWINSLTGELLVSHRGLKTKLESELKMNEVIVPVVNIPEIPTVTRVIVEEKVKKPRKNQKIINEVVEYNLSDSKEIIGE